MYLVVELGLRLSGDGSVEFSDAYVLANGPFGA